MTRIEKGSFRARLATTAQDLQAAQQLRQLSFSGAGADPFDAACQHVLIEHSDTGHLVCSFRFMILKDARDIETSYSAQFYDLSKLRNFNGSLLEIGRFCRASDITDPDILRIAWAMITRLVTQNDIQMLFGCTSFEGTNPDVFEDAFALLKERHLAPKRWAPQIKAPRTVAYADKLRGVKPDLKTAQKTMPPLLRSYLTMGGWVSDHGVIDPDMNTIHVFTGVEISAIPAARKRLLMADAD
ncbi:MAG: ornithine-acyl-ACP acyltransferase [Rhodobacteraceae bacterium]|nr:MAG: ornithine-acyl-ACP acyltransferase [Paracoccaceae bacterium]